MVDNDHKTGSKSLKYQLKQYIIIWSDLKMNYELFGIIHVKRISVFGVHQLSHIIIEINPFQIRLTCLEKIVRQFILLTVWFFRAKKQIAQPWKAKIRELWEETESLLMLASTIWNLLFGEFGTPSTTFKIEKMHEQRKNFIIIGVRLRQNSVIKAFYICFYSFSLF